MHITASMMLLLYCDHFFTKRIKHSTLNPLQLIYFSRICTILFVSRNERKKQIIKELVTPYALLTSQQQVQFHLLDFLGNFFQQTSLRSKLCLQPKHFNTSFRDHTTLSFCMSFIYKVRAIHSTTDNMYKITKK